MISEEDEYRNENIVDDKLLAMTNSIINMRKKLDSVNTRFAYIRHELSDQHEYVRKLAKLKNVLEEQESLLKKEVVEIAQRILRRRFASFERINSPQNITGEDEDVSIENMSKYQKEEYNKMVKLRSEIKIMRDLEEFQTERLKELEKIKGIIFRLVVLDDSEE